MAIIYCIDHERRIVLARGYGAFTDDDVFQYQHAAWSGSETAGFNELVDMTLVTDIQLVSIHRVHDLALTAADMDAPPPRSSKLAVVAPDDFAFGMGRMYEAYRELHPDTRKEVEIFRVMADALAFLEIPKAPESGEVAKSG